MRFPIGFALSLVLFCASAIADERADKIDAIMQSVVTGFIKPGYDDFHVAAERLSSRASELCTEPSELALDNMQTEFAKVAKSWSEIEVVRFGPVAKENRFERILFYPDRRGLGLRQTQRILANEDESASSPETLRNKSVAVQGLGALEFLLFGSGFESLATGNPFRCAYGKAISQNLFHIATEIVNEWNISSIVQTWTIPGEHNPILRSENEAINEIMGTLVHGLETIRDQRIGAFLKAAPGKDRPRVAIFRRSQITLAVIAGEVRSIRRLIETSGIKRLLADDDKALVDTVLFELQTVERTTQSMSEPVAQLLVDDQARARFVYLKTALSFAINVLDQDIARAAGLSSGFSFSDGD